MIHILVADDEALEREAMLHILASADAGEPMHVQEAVNGIEALKIAQTQKPDIAFLDIRMPGVDGLGVAEKLSLLSDPPVIIIVTAYDYFAYARTALRFGVLDYLLKPASKEDVCSVFRKALREIARKKEETARSSAVQTIASDLEEVLKSDICDGLRSGAVDDSAIQRLVTFRTGAAAWSCVAIAAGLGRPASVDDSSIASRDFSRFFHALAQRFLISDLGLANTAALLLIASSEQEDHAEKEAGQTETATKNLLVVVPQNVRMPHAGQSGSSFDVRYLQEEIGDRIGKFYHRCRDAGIVGLRFGVGAEKDGNARVALQTAQIAFSLSNAERPILLLHSVHEIQQEQASFPDSLSALVVAWLRDHFMESIGILDIASELKISPSHLSRVLRKEIGIGFGEMLARIRIARAKTLLANGISAKEASLLVGFRDQSYFTKVFMKLEAVSPSQYSEQFQAAR